MELLNYFLRSGSLGTVAVVPPSSASGQLVSEPTDVPTKGEQTRAAILAAAIERFSRDGFRATSVADIARAAEVGGTVAYAYFPNKEALFLAAVDQDAAGVIEEGLGVVLSDPSISDWRDTIIFTLVDAVERHPLARRLLAGLEPEVTGRVLQVPALEDVRIACIDRIRDEQAAGTVRNDVDAATMGSGVIAIVLSLLMSVVQVGRDSASAYASDVAAVFRAALEPPA